MRGHTRAACFAAVLGLAPAAVATGGCGASSDAGPGVDPVVLRVAAPSGLSTFSPSLSTNGTTAAALDLVYEPVAQHARVRSEQADTLVLALVPESRLSSTDLARGIRFDSIERVQVLDDTRVAVSFSDARAQRSFMQWAGVDVGPFRLERQTDSSVRLVRRGGSAIDVIEIEEMSTQDEKNRMHGRQLDVIPFAEQRRRRLFANLDSVRIVDFPGGQEIALFMNTRNTALADVRVRRKIARALDRRAISRAVCGGPECEARPPLPPEAHGGTMPGSLTLFTQQGDMPTKKIAEAVRAQLRNAVGIEVQIESVDLSGTLEIVMTSRAQLTVSPFTSGPHRYELFVSPSKNKLVSIAGYANPAYDAAVADGKLGVAQSILDRDVPITLLLVQRNFAVIDERFCGEARPSDTSWRWLADLRPCRRGERP